ncbi:MAG: hypothetical protein ACI85I_000041 [Arenicella sp.]|jgi:hypothetical protein
MKDENIHDFFTELAEELDGIYLDYTGDSGAMNLKLPNGRTQSVKSFIKDKGEGDMIIFMSKICRLDEFPDKIDFKKMLELNHRLVYSKVVIDEDYMEVESDANLELSNREEIKYIIREVAKVADDLEHEITGQDIY